MTSSLDSPSSVPSNKSINVPASPRRNTPSDDEDSGNSDDEDNVLTIKLVSSSSSMHGP